MVVMHDMALIPTPYPSPPIAWMGELHDRCIYGNPAVALGWWLDCDDESGECEMRVITTLRLVVITGIAMGGEGWEVGGGSCFFFFGTPPL